MTLTTTAKSAAIAVLVLTTAPTLAGGNKACKMQTSFRRDESGAVTVDWVVLTRVIIGLGVAVVAPVGAGTADLAG